MRLLNALNPQGLDERLLRGEPPEADPDLAERRERLLDPSHRRELAQMIERVLNEAFGPPCPPYRWCSAKVPLRRSEIRKNRALLLALARDLVEEPEVEVRGLILVDQLLRNGGSPLYVAGRTRAQEQSVELAVRHARTAMLLR